MNLFSWIFVISLVILILTTIYIVLGKSKKKDKEVKEPNHGEKPHSEESSDHGHKKDEHGHEDSHGHGHSDGEKWQKFYQMLGTIIVIAIAIGIIFGINGWFSGHSSQDSSQISPDSYSKIYHIKKGEPVRVYIPENYQAEYFGYGKKYYHKDQDESTPCGGDKEFRTGSQHVQYFDLSYYNEEVDVKVIFTKCK